MSSVATFGYKTFWILGCGQRFHHAFRSQKYTKSMHFDNISKIRCFLSQKYTLIKRSILTKMIDPFLKESHNGHFENL